MASGELGLAFWWGGYNGQRTGVNATE